MAIHGLPMLPNADKHPNAFLHRMCHPRAVAGPITEPMEGRLVPKWSPVWPVDTVMTAQGTTMGTTVHSLKLNSGTDAAVFLAVQGATHPRKSTCVLSKYTF